MWVNTILSPLQDCLESFRELSHNSAVMAMQCGFRVSRSFASSIANYCPQIAGVRPIENGYHFFVMRSQTLRLMIDASSRVSLATQSFVEILLKRVIIIIPNSGTVKFLVTSFRYHS